MQVSVGDDGDVRVRRDRFEHGNGEGNVMVIFGVALPKNEAVDGEVIVDEDDEGFGGAVDLLVPAEVGDDGEVNVKEGTCDRLSLGLKPRTMTLAVNFLRKSRSRGQPTAASGNYAPISVQALQRSEYRSIAQIPAA